MSQASRIDLLQGSPAPSLLPIQRLKDAAISALSNPEVTSTALDYGPDEGHFPLRTNIGKWLTGFYHPSQAVSADRICITGGASQNLSCILQVFTDPSQTRYVWMPQATYHLAFRIFEDAGFSGRLKPIPEDQEGIDVDFLQASLENAGNAPFGEITKPPRPYRKIYKHIIYCVPTFSNPTGVTMPVSRRQALVRLARKYDALVICDDVYDFLQWNSSGSPDASWGSSLPRIVDIDRSLDGGPQDDFGHVVSNGSFSKIVAPGCRVGWTEAETKFIRGLSQVGSTLSGGAPSQLMSTFIDEMLQDGSLPKHIQHVLVPSYAQRYSILTSAIKQHLVPLGVQIHGSSASSPSSKAGGFFIWIKLPQSLTASKVVEKALQEENLVLGLGSLFAVRGPRLQGSDLDQCLRLCFALEDEDCLSEGIRRLKRVVIQLLGRGNI